MLYVMPVSSTLHFDPHPHHSRRELSAFVSRCTDHHGYCSSDVAQAILEEEGLWRFGRERLRRLQAEEVARRRLYESIYAAQQREIDHARDIAIATARRRHFEERVRCGQAAKGHLVQPEMNELQRALFALFSHSALNQSVHSEQISARRVPTLQKRQTVSGSTLTGPAAGGLGIQPQAEVNPEIPDMLRSVLQVLFPHRSPEVVPESNQPPALHDKGKGKARAEDVVDPQPIREVNTSEKAIREYLEDFFRPVPRPSEAGPSGIPSAEPNTERHVSCKENSSGNPAVSTSTSKQSLPTSSEPAAAELGVEATERARTKAISSINDIKSTLNILESGFQLPTTLDHYQTTPDHDDAASVSSTASDLSRLLPYTANNASVHAYENALGTLLERLDGVESGGDLEVREARRMVVKGVEKALAVVESAIESEITKRAELIGEDATVLESQSEAPTGYSINVTPAAEVDLVVPSKPSTPETPITVADADSQSINIGSRDDEASVHNSMVNTCDEQPAPALESLSVSLTEANESSLPPVSKEVTVEPVPHSPQTISQDEAITLEVPSDVQLPVEEINTFLLPASRQAPPAARNTAEGDEVEDEAVVVDAERSGDEWLEVEA